MVPWVECPTLNVDLDLPLSQRFDSLPPEAITAGKNLLAAVMKEIPPAGRWLAYLVRLRTLNRFHKEAISLARHVDADWREVMVANITYDLMLATIGCSTVALPTPSGPVVARNMDWWPEDILAQSSYLLRFFRKGHLHFANAGWPGAIGVVTGLSGRGFAVVLNAVQGSEKFSRLGYPVLLHLRRVLEDAKDFAAALAMLTEERLTVSALFTLVGSDNQQRVVIERTPTRHALRWPKGNEPLVATNDYRLLFRPETHAGAEIYQTTCTRYDALCTFFAGHRPDQNIDDAALLYILTDPQVIQTITAQHIIMRPRTRQIRMLVPRHLLGGHAEEVSGLSESRGGRR